MNVAPSTAAGRAAQQLGIAALLGGNLFGRVAMHPALEGVCGPEDRGKVVNAAWRRYGTVNSIALAGVVGGWLGTRTDERGDAGLVRAKDVAVGAVVVTGVASAIAGVAFGASAPGGAVPLESGSEPASGAPREVTRLKHLLNGLGRASAVAEVALVAVDATLGASRRRRLSRR
ncbi:MAG: hypothetical protein QOG63_1568 [Thermoleophilaceae bacterium]|jgi:hypothetical protein|nr:hypothetical protein [Thermoleophilaceae bacterium]